MTQAVAQATGGHQGLVKSAAPRGQQGDSSGFRKALDKDALQPRRGREQIGDDRDAKPPLPAGASPDRMRTALAAVPELPAAGESPLPPQPEAPATAASPLPIETAAPEPSVAAAPMKAPDRQPASAPQEAVGAAHPAPADREVPEALAPPPPADSGAPEVVPDALAELRMALAARPRGEAAPANDLPAPADDGRADDEPLALPDQPEQADKPLRRRPPEPVVYFAALQNLAMPPRAPASPPAGPESPEAIGSDAEPAADAADASLEAAPQPQPASRHDPAPARWPDGRAPSGDPSPSSTPARETPAPVSAKPETIGDLPGQTDVAPAAAAPPAPPRPERMAMEASQSSTVGPRLAQTEPAPRPAGTPPTAGATEPPARPAPPIAQAAPAAEAVAPQAPSGQGAPDPIVREVPQGAEPAQSDARPVDQPAAAPVKMTVVAQQGFLAPAVASPSPTVQGLTEAIVLSQPPRTDAAEALTGTHGDANGTRTLQIQLRPAELGMVIAQLRSTGDRLTIELKVESAEAAQRLSRENDTLVASLRAQGYEIDKVTVIQPQAAAPTPTRADVNQMATGQQSRDASSFAPGGSGSNGSGAGGQPSGRHGNGAGSTGREHAQPQTDRSGGGLFI